MLQKDESFDSLEARAKAAWEEAERLDAQLRRESVPPQPGRPRGRRRVVRHHHAGNLPLAPNYHAMCYVGSLYATLLSAMARLGNLRDHDRLFAEFKRKQTPQTARKLLDAIGVCRPELDMFVRADQQFKAHCAIRTTRLRERAAKGDTKARGILSNRSICDKHRRWIGDIDEAIAILHGNREPGMKGIRKNVQIISKMGLLFTTTQRAGASSRYLFPDKFFRLFQSARTLAGE